MNFEAAVEAVVAGDTPALESMLRENPELIRARSARPHRATLLHYIAANGVEDERQKTPPNAVEVAKILLTAGAEADALAEMYGGQCATLSMLVSSCHPARAGVQVALLETLLDFGASPEPSGAGKWKSPLMTALAFGYKDAAEALVKRGARAADIAAAAGLGWAAEVARGLAASDADTRHRALALAAQHGHADIVNMLLDAGEDPNRYNPPGNHGHSTPLHQAANAGHEAVVRLLVERGARLDIQDTVYRGTPLGWACYAKQRAIADYLRSVPGSRNPNVTQAIPFFGVSHMEASLRFYLDGLRFLMTNNWVVDGKVRWCWLSAGAAAIMLRESKPLKVPPEKPGLGVSVCFQCKDALAIYHDVKSRGIEATEPQVGNGMWEFGVTDPDGYKLFFESVTDVPEETKLSEWKI